MKILIVTNHSYVLHPSRQDRERMGLKAHQKMQREFEKNTVVQKTIQALLG